MSNKKIGVDVAPQDGIIDYYTADVVTANDYYAFGSLQPGRNYNAPGATDPIYGFNGKMNDNDVKGEGNQIDYGERIYDPRLGRFYSVDPMFKDFPELTTYQYGSNNPIFNIDLDGLEGTGGAEKLIQQGGTTTLKVATKYGVEQGAKVVAMKATEKIVTSPGVWSKIGAGLGWLGTKAAGVVGFVLSPANGHQPYRTWEVAPPGFTLGPGNTLIPKPQPAPNPTALPNPNPNNDDGDNNKPKIFYATYTKTHPETGQTYAGRTSGICQCPNGSEPTEAEARLAVQGRQNTHLILNEEGFDPAVLDKASTNKIAIRGREQDLVDAAGGAQKVDGGTARNKIRAVSRKKAAFYQAASQSKYGKLPNNNPADKKTP